MGRLNAVLAVAPEFSEEAGRQWCHTINAQFADRGVDRWYFVGKSGIEAREGLIATEVRRVLDGWYPDYHGWEPERLAGEFRLLRYFARMGMPQAVFDTVKLAA